MIITAILYALAAVESGGNPKAIGRAGERSAYQMTEAVWREETVSMPFELATTDPAIARWIAGKHVRNLIGRIVARGDAPTPAAIARAWNPGAPADYAERVASLYFDYCNHE